MINMDEYEIGRTKTIIGMAIDFTAMIRVFEKGSTARIGRMIEEFLRKSSGVNKKSQFDKLHQQFCQEFMSAIRLAKIKAGQSSYASYGQAAKVLDVSLKACVDFCQLPNPETSKRIKPFLHAGIDTPILEFLKREEHLEINVRSVKDIDRQRYKIFQDAVAKQIVTKFGGRISPVMWDNIMWRRLNRESFKPTEALGSI